MDVLIELDIMFLNGDPFTPINSTLGYSEVFHASVQKFVAHLVCNLANYCLLGFVVCFFFLLFFFEYQKASNVIKHLKKMHNI